MIELELVDMQYNLQGVVPRGEPNALYRVYFSPVKGMILSHMYNVSIYRNRLELGELVFVGTPGTETAILLTLQMLSTKEGT